MSDSFAVSDPSALPGMLELQQLLDQFDGLMGRVEQFAAEQAEVAVRLSQVVQEHPEIPSELQISIKQFMAAREAWEQERERQAAQLNQDQAMLAEAWQRLEAEERKVVSQHTDRKAVVTRDPEPANNATRCYEVADAGSPKTTSTSNETMMLQYKQLRREMQKHTLRGRK